MTNYLLFLTGIAGGFRMQGLRNFRFLYFEVVAVAQFGQNQSKENAPLGDGADFHFF